MTAAPALNRPVLCISRVRLCILLLPSNEDMPSGVRRRHPAAAALLRDNLFIILLIPLVAVSAVRSVCVRTVITVAPDAAHYEDTISSYLAPLYYITLFIISNPFRGMDNCRIICVFDAPYTMTYPYLDN